MAYVTVGGQHHHHQATNDAAGGGGSAAGGGAGGAGGSTGEQENSGGGGGGVQLADNSGGGGSNSTGGSPGAYGPGEGAGGTGGGGFMPNGENGLLILADYARTKSGGENSENSTDNSDQAPGLPPGDVAGDGGPSDGFTPFTGDEPGLGPHGDGVTTDTAGGGFGFGIGGFGGGGGGGGAGGGGAGGSGGSGGGAGPGGPSLTDPPTPPGTNPILSDPGPGTTPGDGGQVCAKSILDDCGQLPADPPFTSKPPAGDPPVGPHGGGGAPGGENLVGGDIPGVPEPAAWLTMILGLGAVGAALRAHRRRALA
jgi:hypothetical protein